MILFYESSNGNVFNLKVGKIRARTANLHDFQWVPEAIEQQYGERVFGFNKPATSYNMLLSIDGNLEERRQQLNLLHDAFEHDVRNMTPGKLIHGNAKIDCYIIVSSTFPENPWTHNELSVYCPYPFWITEREYHMDIIDDVSEYPFLDYPYDFNYDYSAVLTGYANIENYSVGSADFQLSIYGPVENPVVVINGIKVGVVTSIGAAEKIVVNSKNKTVVLYGAKQSNLFNNRLKEQSIFTPIPSGLCDISWNGQFAFDLTLYEERSEPMWI